MKINFLWTACLVAITGCDSPQNHHSRIESGETKTEKQLENLNFYGTYEGILPAADCEGIRTALTLNNDNTYVLRSEYIGEKDAIFESKGSYHFINGRLMELAQSSSNEKSYYKILDGSKVMLSDKEGTVNQGVLAEYYILKKEIKTISIIYHFSIPPHLPPRGGFLYTVFQPGTLTNLIHPPRRQKKSGPPGPGFRQHTGVTRTLHRLSVRVVSDTKDFRLF